MKIADIPTQFPIPFANAAGGGFITYPIPEASQIGVTDGAASLTDGFPPANFLPVGSGGTPPRGGDFNGLLKQITQWSQWAGAGNALIYDSQVATDIGGYPQGAILSAIGGGNLWLCIVDDNTANPDNGGTGWVPISVGRLRLSADFSLFVSTSGSDNNNGFTSGTPFATLQHAWNYLQNNVDLNGFTATINIADGTYTAGAIAKNGVVGSQGAGSVVFLGNTSVPTNCSVSVTNASCFQANNGSGFTVNGVKVAATGTGSGQGYGFLAGSQSQINILKPSFGSCAVAHIGAQNGGLVAVGGGFGGYTISGSAQFHYLAQSGGIIATPDSTAWTATLSGTPAFTIFASAQSLGQIDVLAATFTGSATGQRYNAITNAIISTSSGGASYFPGNSAGTTATGGQYT